MRLIITIGCLLCLLAGAARAVPPAATQPAGFTLRGQIITAANLGFDGPDLSRAVVYLESDPALDAAPIPAQSAIVAQQNKAFVPNFIVVPRGTKIEFPNWDHIDHNVFSRSAAAPAFDLDRYAYGQSKSRVFDKIGIVQLFCNIHPFMRALIVVTPNIYFANADGRGNFKIDNIPAGQYQISVWQERCATLHQTVKIGSDQNAPVSFTLSENRDSILENDPPSHGDRWGVDRGLGVKREKLNLPVVTESHPAPTTEPCPNCN